MRLTVVFDSHSEGHAIYIEGMNRAKFDEGNLDVTDLIECYETFARDKPVVLEHVTINADKLGIWDDDQGTVEWPEQLGSLFVVEANRETETTEGP